MVAAGRALTGGCEALTTFHGFKSVYHHGRASGVFGSRLIAVIILIIITVVHLVQARV